MEMHLTTKKTKQKTQQSRGGIRRLLRYGKGQLLQSLGVLTPGMAQHAMGWPLLTSRGTKIRGIST